MEDTNQLVTEKVEKGIYFNEAMSWYFGRYIFVHTQFSQMLIVAIIALTAFILTFLGFVEFLPITDKKAFVMYHDMQPNSSIRVMTLMKPGQDPDNRLSDYLIGEYVKSREEYIVEKSERDFNFVYSISDDRVLEDYLAYVNPENPLSPYVVYANRGRRNISIRDVTFLDEKGKATTRSQTKGKAVVKFSAQENFGAQGEKVADYVANIEFAYKKVQVDQKTGQLTHKPEMVITGYTTKASTGSR